MTSCILIILFSGCQKDTEDIKKQDNTIQNTASEEINEEGDLLIGEEEIWKYYSKKDFQIDSIKTFVDKE